VKAELHAFISSALDGGEWSASRPGRFTPREKAPDTHWIGGWVGPRGGLDAVMKRKILSPCRDSSPSIIQPVAQRYATELYRLTELPRDDLNRKYKNFTGDLEMCMVRGAYDGLTTQHEWDWKQHQIRCRIFMKAIYWIRNPKMRVIKKLSFGTEFY
jgi:hypothetical protein